MKFKLGEFVRFVDEKREGYITRIFNSELIGVTGDDDFEIPVPVNKVTRVHGHEYSSSENQINAEIEVPPGSFEKKGIYLAVVPNPSKGAVVSFHLVNATSFQLLASLTTHENKRYKGCFANTIAPHSTEQVYFASLSDIDLWPRFNFQILFYTAADVEPQKPLLVSEKFKAKNFADAKKQIPFLKQAGWLIRLDEDDLVIDAEKLKESFFKPKEEKSHIDKPQSHIDLHIEKLREDHEFLNASEILNIQLEHFRKALDAAIVHKLGSITFIHGVGNGTLRHEIHKAISKHPQVKTFMDARKEKFGYGATEVFLK